MEWARRGSEREIGASRSLFNPPSPARIAGYFNRGFEVFAKTLAGWSKDRAAMRFTGFFKGFAALDMEN